MKPAKAYEKIGEKLKTIRVRLNMSLPEFGERLGLTKASISTYERGIRTSSRPVLCLMADEYRVNIAYLETGNEPIFVGQEGDKRESILPSQQDADRATADVIAAFWRCMLK